MASRLLGQDSGTAWRLGLVVWLGVLIATPIGLRLWGREAFLPLVSLGVLAQFAAVCLALSGPQFRLRRLALVLALIAALTWGIELFGSRSGIPFGRYHYTSLLQPQLGGVPLLIPLAWTMMLLPARAVAPLWTASGRLPGFALQAALTGLAFTAWDLYLDPFMVSQGLWIWEQPGSYFGIPWTNYLGWWLSAVVVTAAVRLVFPGFALTRAMRRRLVVVYALTWLFQGFGSAVFWGQPGPALAGFVGMGVFAVPALWRMRRGMLAVNVHSRAGQAAGEQA